MQNVHEHENSIIGQSKRRRCTFSCDFPLFHSFSLITHLNTPAVTSTTLEKKSDYTLFNVIFPNVWIVLFSGLFSHQVFEALPLLAPQRRKCPCLKCCLDRQLTSFFKQSYNIKSEFSNNFQTGNQEHIFAWGFLQDSLNSACLFSLQPQTLALSCSSESSSSYHRCLLIIHIAFQI